MTDDNPECIVAYDRGALKYPENPPFHPGQRYPEYPFGETAEGSANFVYESVRELLRHLRLDPENYGTSAWNPLGGIIKPGQQVLVKPNFVLHFHAKKILDVAYHREGPLEAVITHGSVIRAILDYVLIALAGKGSVVVGDAPDVNGNFMESARLSGLMDVREFLNDKTGAEVRLVDFRRIASKTRTQFRGLFNERLDGDPRGYRVIDLGTSSELHKISGGCGIYHSVGYSLENVSKHHNTTVNEYCISQTVLDSDVLVNIPKLKTHRKSGVTLALKNIVGVNADKNFLPHYRIGCPSEGGDEYYSRHKPMNSLNQIKRSMQRSLLGKSRLELLAYLLFEAPYRVSYSVLKGFFPNSYDNGNWFGNDTVWRMIIDLNKILIYADKNGSLASTPQRRVFTLIDGVVGGEGEGPLEPSRRDSSLLIAGFNPVAVDIVASRLMGFDYKRIPQLKRASERRDLMGFPAEDISVVSGGHGELPVESVPLRLDFKPPKGWRGHMELQ